MRGYVATAGNVRHLLCLDCVKQMVADIVGDLTHLTLDQISDADLKLLKFPWCDACDASFTNSKKEVLA